MPVYCPVATARYYHDTIKRQRIIALNNSLIALSKSAAAILYYIHANNINTPTSNIFKNDIDHILTLITNDANKIKQDIKIISNCNYQWLSIQPIVTNNDIQTYYTFMNATYLTTMRDIVMLCNRIDEYITTFADRLHILKSEYEADSASWYSYIVDYLYTWIPWSK